MKESNQLLVTFLTGFAVLGLVLGFHIRDLQGIVDEQDAYILLLEGRLAIDDRNRRGKDASSIY